MYIVNRVVKKYLSSRAILSPWQLTGTARKNFAAVIVIPALAERDSLPQTLASLNNNPPENLDQTLIIVVVNNRCDVSAELLEENQATLKWLQSDPFPRLNLAWVDASSPKLELAPKEGVGLARKIGFDACLLRLDWQKEPILISLDADTLVDSNYLSAIFSHFQSSKAGGTAIPFRHQKAENEEQEKAIRRYELYLRSYMFGLQLARSPYAYHTIGSAFACRASAYMKSGGMNRRCGGEDFYFLQQVAKVAGVDLLKGTIVSPSPRFSDRVTFGTGKAVEGQVADQVSLFTFVTAGSFKRLKGWLVVVEDQLDASAEQILENATDISSELVCLLDQLNFSRVWKNLQNNHSSPTQRLTAFHAWFDALRTRQLLMRLEGSSRFPSEEVLAGLLAWGGYRGINSCSEQLKYLEELQGVQD